MTEADVRAWIAARFGAEGLARVDAVVAAILAETAHQNLIAPSTIDDIWTRHVLDSIQLAPLAGAWTHWGDVGTGGGFPGLVIAAATAAPVTMIEPRRLRAEFLARTAAALGLDQAQAVTSKVERVAGPFDVISARAVAPVGKLLSASFHCATPDTRWLLLRGRYDVQEIRSLERDWRFMFHVEQSLSDAESSILILTEVRRR